MFNKILEFISGAVWGLPTVALIVGAGGYFTIRLGLPQLRLKSIFGSWRGGESSGEKAASPFQSLSTALAATVGTGSVTGVATALTLGGPGAIFWLWVSAFFGMAVAYAEGYLSVKYRQNLPDGSRRGGIWFALRDGLGAGKTAAVYALFCLLASFGMGSMAQTNSAAEALFGEFSLPKPICGLVCAALIACCMAGSGGFARKLCEGAVPLLAGLYVTGAAAVIAANFSALPSVFSEIFGCAFGLKQAAGGAAGFAAAVSVGFRRGVFSNEAGLGTTAPVHGASSVDDPERQGMMNMLEVIVDTFVICTLTALALLCSGAYPGTAEGAEMVVQSAKTVFGGLSGKLVAAETAGFAIATAVGWSQIGLSAADFLLKRGKSLYKAAFILSAFCGTLFGAGAVWQISDIFNGLMAIPCLTALILLRREIKLTFSRSNRSRVRPAPTRGAPRLRRPRERSRAE